MFHRMYQQIMCILDLNTREQALTWQYILVSYCHNYSFQEKDFLTRHT